MEEHEIVNAREWQLEGDEPPPRPKGSGPPGRMNAVRSQAFGQGLIEALNDVGSENIPKARDGKNPEAASEAKPQISTAPRERGPPPRNNWFNGGNARTTNPKVVPRWAVRPHPHALSNENPAGPHPAGGKHDQSANASPAKAAGRGHTGTFQLPATYGQLRETLSSDGKSSAIVDAIEAIKKTGAYIPPPANHDRTIHIHGTVAQKDAAQGILRMFVSTYDAATAPEVKKKNFAKIKSYFEDKETHIDHKKTQDDRLILLQQPSDPAISYPQTLLFLWPVDELPIDSSLGPNLEEFDPIRREFQCHIHVYGEDREYIRVDGYDHDIMRTIVQRFRAKWAQLMATVNVKTKLYLAQPPSADAIRTEVNISRLSHPGGGLAYAVTSLSGDHLRVAQLEQWTENSRMVRSKNDIRLCDTIENSLQGLRFMHGHVRMRINFGSFVLDTYRTAKPSDSKQKHSFESFRQMLLLDKTKGHLIPGLLPGKDETSLVTVCSNASDLFDPYDATSHSLKDAKPVYAVNVEFVGTDASLLRFEAGFIQHPGARNFEMRERRWVKPQGTHTTGDKRAPLQVGVIDFEKADWQLEIKALEFNEENSTIDQALKTFEHSIKFKTEAAEGGLGAQAKRKVFFSDAVPVSRMIEKSALRYYVKGTNYIFELARYDEYRRVGIEVSRGRVTPPSSLNQLSPKPVTSWGASIYRGDWDNMLGEHANYGVGHAADWRPNLNTFFPLRDDYKSANTRAGFSEFIDFVNKISELLSPRQAKFGAEGSSASASVSSKEKKYGKGPSSIITTTTDKDHDSQKSEAKTEAREEKIKWADILIDSGAVF